MEGVRAEADHEGVSGTLVPFFHSGLQARDGERLCECCLPFNESGVRGFRSTLKLERVQCGMRQVAPIGANPKKIAVILRAENPPKK
eukprot:355464-Chlamydomonas_euryale.AAC.2